MLELTKTLCIEAIKLTFAGVVVTELLHFRDAPGNFLIPGIAAVVLFSIAAYFVQYILTSKAKANEPNVKHFPHFVRHRAVHNRRAGSLQLRYHLAQGRCCCVKPALLDLSLNPSPQERD